MYMARGKIQATLDTVKEHVQHYLQQVLDKGDDVVQSIEDMKLVDLNSKYPTLRVSSAATDAAKAIENKTFEQLFDKQLKNWVDRCDNFESNKRTAYSIIFSKFCTKAMQSRIERHTTFETVIKNDPVALLKQIRIDMHDGFRAQFYTISIKDAINRVFSIEQRDNEHVNDYIMRLKQHRDTLESYIGTKLIDEYYDKAPEFQTKSASQKALLKQGGWELMMATIAIEGADNAKYGSLKKDLRSQLSRGNNQYPKTVDEAQEILGSHKLDDKFFEKTKAQSRARPPPPRTQRRTQGGRDHD